MSDTTTLVCTKCGTDQVGEIDWQYPYSPTHGPYASAKAYPPWFCAECGPTTVQQPNNERTPAMDDPVPDRFRIDLFSPRPTTAEVIERLAQRDPVVGAVYNSARAAGINPHGDRAVREYIIQLHRQSEDYKTQALDALQHKQVPMVVPAEGIPYEGIALDQAQSAQRWRVAFGKLKGKIHHGHVMDFPECIDPLCVAARKFAQEAVDMPSEEG